MRKIASSLLLLSVVQLTQIASGLCSTSEEASIVKAISDSNLLKTDYRVAAVVNGNEAIISAYFNDASKNTRIDMKIDAVLLAKKTMATSKHVTRVKTRFYNLDQTSYREISVTTGDVAAFASGSLSQDKLLASLDANLVELRKDSPLKKASVIRSTTIATDPKPRPNLCKVGGLAFYYPKTWVQKQLAEDGEQGRLVCTSARGDATVSIRIEQVSADEAALRDKTSWAELNAGGGASNAKLGWNQTIQMGYSRKIQGLDLVVQFNKGTSIKLERHVYFRVTPLAPTYHLCFRCNKDEFISLNKDFGAMLATVLPAP